jgi:hypothetical protein
MAVLNPRRLSSFNSPPFLHICPSESRNGSEDMDFSCLNAPPSTTRTKTVNQTSRKLCGYHSSNNYIVWKLINLSVSWERYWLCTIMDENPAVITYSSTSLYTGMLVHYTQVCSFNMHRYARSLYTGMLILRDTSSSFVCQCQNVHQLKLWRRKIIKKSE